jgi:PPOX class probable F420-dependent enzyme
MTSIADTVAFVAAHHHGVLATRRRDGSPQLTPVTVGVDPDGVVEISSRETAYKVRNILRDPQVSLCVFTNQFYGPWVLVTGTATILSLPDALEPLVEYYRRISGEHPDWDDYRRAMVDDRRALIRITIEEAGPARHG